MKNITRVTGLLLYSVIIFLLSSAQANATTFTVSNTNDSGAGSLRQAIIDLNATGADGDIIQFTAAGTIALESALPDLDHETKFDTNGNEVSLTANSGGTIVDKWFKFESAGTSAFTVGAGAAWDIGGGLVVGDNANGSLTISGGGDVTSAYSSYVGGNDGSLGTFTVTGSGSTWANASDIFVGNHGTGTLTISSGGLVSDTWGNIAGEADSTGTGTVTGTGSTWTNTNDIIVGKNGAGILNITDGGTVTSDKGLIASEVGSTGEVTVDGENSTWTMTGGLTVGNNGPGELNITDGGTVSDDYTDVGYNDVGEVTVDGAGSTWNNTGDLNIGKAYDGFLTISGGGAVNSAHAYAAKDAGSHGAIYVGDAGSTLSASSDLSVGDSGTGELVVYDGATVTVNSGSGTITLGKNADSEGLLVIGAEGAATSGTVDAAEVTGGSGSANLVFGQTDDFTFDPIISGSIAVQQKGTGTTTLSGNNTYTGSTSIQHGTIKLGHDSALGTQDAGTTVDEGASLDLNGHDLFTASEDEPLSIAGSGTGGEGALFNSSAGMSTYSGSITLTAASTIGVTDAAGSMLLYRSIDTGVAGYNLTFDGDGDFLVMNTFTGKITGNGDVIKNGAGELLFYMTGDDYTGATTVNEGRLTIGASGVVPDASALSIALGAELNLNGKNETIGSLSGAGNVINTAGAGTLTAGGNDGSTTFSGVISDGAGATAFTKEGTGILTFSGANTYSGATLINAGTVVAGNASALGNGSAVTVGAGGTLDVGTTNVTVNNTYTQNGTLKVTVASPSSSGKITSNADAAVAAGSSVNVTVPSGIYIPNNAAFTVIDGAGGAGVNIPGTITSSDPRLKFSALSSSGDLILMASRLGTGFSSIATDPNGAAVGAVLDNILDPTADMTDVLNTLEGLDDQQVASALDTFVPVVDSGVIESSNVSLNQFIGVTTDRLTGLYARARGSAGETGVSAGCEGLQGFEAWGRGFGEYLRQDPRGLSNGYRATVWGTAIGGDIPAFNNRVRMGLSGGYAQSGINSKDNSGKTDIDSYQGTLYAGYIDAENPYYLNGAFSFAYNKYDSLRHIAVGTIMRTANSDYDGQQYSVLFDGGYTFKSGEFGITPIASLQYERLHLEGYTEKNAGAFNLHVNSQNYDMLQSGLGMKLERPFKTETGTIIPEIHAKWLYDFIGDRQETTSTFSGGGGSFATNGFDPAQNSLNAGAKMTLIANNNWVLETNYDFEYKEDFTAHTGWADLRYKF